MHKELFSTSYEAYSKLSVEGVACGAAKCFGACTFDCRSGKHTPLRGQEAGAWGSRCLKKEA